MECAIKLKPKIKLKDVQSTAIVVHTAGFQMSYLHIYYVSVLTDANTTKIGVSYFANITFSKSF